MPRGTRLGAAATAVATVLALLTLFAAQASAANTFTVVSNGDAPDVSVGDNVCATTGGVCTLRAAIEESNVDPGNQIHFNLPGGSTTISPASSLPAIHEITQVRGDTQPGYAGAPLVVVSGASVATPSANNAGFEVLNNAQGAEIQGLAINGFGGPGIIVRCNIDVSIKANYIGTNAAGTSAVPNATGISVLGNGSGPCDGVAARTVIGGLIPAYGNVISGNTGRGVRLEGLAPNTDVAPLEIVVRNNRIGVAANGAALGNGGVGVQVSGGGWGQNTISENEIANNVGDGIEVRPLTNLSGNAVNRPSGNIITQNLIGSNGGLGIDLLGYNANGPTSDGVTLNDALDADTGANGLQNFPYLDTAATTTSDVTGQLYAQPSTTYSIEIFANSGGCDASGYGEGGTYLDSVSVTTDSAGHATFSRNLPGIGLGQTMTATARSTSGPAPPNGTNGSTSEFSPCRTVTASPTPQRTLTVTSPTNGAITGLGINCGSGAGQNDCTETYGDGQPVRLLAAPASDYVLLGWGGDCSGTGPCDLTMSADRSLNASFGHPDRTLIVNAGNPVEAATITGPGINCGTSPAETDCTESYPNGTNVTLTQTTHADYAWLGWNGDCTGLVDTCDLAMTQDRSVSPGYRRANTLTVSVSGTGGGTVTGTGFDCGTTAAHADCTEVYAGGFNVGLTANPEGGSTVSWTGVCAGAVLNGCFVFVDQSRNVGVIFTAPGSPPPLDPPPGDPPVGDPPGGDPPSGANGDTTPPDTILDVKPTKVKKKASFSFPASETATFECAVDSAAFATCVSPFKTKKLKPGKHKFAVRATDAAGNVDQSAATASFKVKKKKKKRR